MQPMQEIVLPELNSITETPTTQVEDPMMKELAAEVCVFVTLLLQFMFTSF